MAWSVSHGPADAGLQDTLTRLGHGERCCRGLKPPAGIDAVYSLRISQSRRATAHRDGNFIRLLTIAPDHDATYGKQ